MFAFLPTEREGYVCLSQNRFSKVRGDRQLEFPILPAYGLTQLKQSGFEVSYVDSIWESLSPEKFYERVEKISPDIIFFETKTPQIKQSWKISNELKKRFPKIKIAAMGDHVSVLPEETLQNSNIDFVITGGDFDVGMLKLSMHLFKKNEMPKGIYYREIGLIKNSGKFELLENLDELPFIDYGIIPWKDYHENWMLFDEVIYILASRGCPYRCTFCSWPQMLYSNKVRMRSVQNVLREMELLIKKYDVKEFFFDDDTFNWNKQWVRDFCNGIIEKGWEIIWDCNARVDSIDEEQCVLMKKSGCRLIKFGVESANPNTLERINKGFTIEQIKNGFDLSKKAGLLRHATVMIGYPWETKEDMQKTINFIKELDVDTCQFTMRCVYTGTKLWQESAENKWLKFNEGEWEKFDMSVTTLKNEHVSEEEIVKIVESAWLQVYFEPKFLLRKILSVKSPREFLWLMRGTKGVVKGNLLPLLNPRKKEDCSCQNG